MFHLKKNKYETSIEFYYKKMQDLITYSEGSNILGTNFPLGKIVLISEGSAKPKVLSYFLRKIKVH